MGLPYVPNRVSILLFNISVFFVILFEVSDYGSACDVTLQLCLNHSV